MFIKAGELKNVKCDIKDLDSSIINEEESYDDILFTLKKLFDEEKYVSLYDLCV